MDSIVLSALFFGMLRGATPLVFAALGGLFSERAGVVQIALEGMMLLGALAAAVVALETGNPWLGWIAAGFAGGLGAILFSFFTLKLKSDQIITGTALNILALGIAPFVTKAFYNSSGSTPSLDIASRFSFEPILLAAVATAAATYLFYYTRAGLWLQFAGEEPSALLASGVSVQKTRWGFVGLTGILAGFGGASLSLFLASNYSPNMTAGRGFMALAALIFGRWKPIPTVGACLLFAFVDALQIQLQGKDIGLPIQFIQVLPYLVTIVVLAGFFGRSRAPKALGKHVRES